MRKIVGLWMMCICCASIPVFSQVDTTYIYNTSMPYGTLDLRIRKSDTRYYYLQEDVTFSFRESAPGVKTNTYTDMTSWDSSPYRQGNLREKNGAQDLFVMNYRVLFPNNYNPQYEPGYPIIIMLHGYGERGNCWFDNCYWSTTSWNPNTNSPPAPTAANNVLLNNDHNLLHGGNPHLTAVNRAGAKLPNDPTLAANAFPGIVLFPQVMNGWQQTARVEDAIKLLRLMIKKYNVDENRVYIHGLSNGGGGVFQAIKRAPWLFSAALAMSAVTNANIYGDGLAPEVGKLPMWLFQGGKDTNPTPSRTYLTVRQFREAGADVRYNLYPNLGHGTWNTAYNEPDFFSWIRSKKKTQPHVFYGNPVICNTTGAGVRIGFSNGFFAYQWEFDGAIVPGATASEFVANEPGTVRGRFSRKPNPREEDWEPWSDPIVVSEISPVKPTIEVSGSTHLRGPGLPSIPENNAVTFTSDIKAELYTWYRNGVPVEFPGTDVYDTLRTATITSAGSGANGAYTLKTSFSYCPSPPSDPVYVFFNNTAPQNMSIDPPSAAFTARIVQSGVLLSWNDLVSKETAYEVWRKKSTDPYFSFVGRAPQDALTYYDKILQPNTTYQYKLRAVSNTGVSNYLPSNIVADAVSITTPGDTKAPVAPQELRVIDNTINSITLAWKPAVDNAAISHYVIQYGNNSVSTQTALTTFTIADLPQNSLVPISVKAVDFAGLASPASNQVIGSTYVLGLRYKHSTGAWETLNDPALQATFTDPEFVGTINNFSLAPRTQEDYFNFQYTGYLDVLTSGQYLFRLQSGDGSRLFIDGAMVIDNDGVHGNVTRFSDTLTLTQGPHRIEVQYFEYAGGQSLTLNYKGPVLTNSYRAIPDSLLRSGRYVQPSPPAAPAGLMAMAVGMERVDVTWAATGSSVEIYRSAAVDGVFSIIGRSEAGLFVDTVNTLPGKTYYYKARTVSQNALSGFSTIVSATTATDGESPTIPTGLTLLNKSHTAVSIIWNASTDNTVVSHYEILANGVLAGKSDVPSFMATALEPNIAYSFTVVAVDGNGNKSVASAPLVVNTSPSAIYYSLATGNLNDPNTWRQNVNGTGGAPADFAANGQVFVISNRTTTTTGGAWEVSGSASKVIVPSGVTLIIDQEFSGKMQVEGNGVVRLNHPSTPDFLSLSAQSSLYFNTATEVPVGTYGNLYLNGPALTKTLGAGLISVVGNLTVADGVALHGAPGNETTFVISGGLTLLGRQGAVAPDNRPGFSFTAASHVIESQGDFSAYSVNVASTGTVTFSTASPQRVILGSGNGGGLIVNADGRMNMGSNTIQIIGAGSINPDQQTGVVVIASGDVKLRSTAAATSFLNLANEGHEVDTLLLDAIGGLSIQSPVSVMSSVMVKNGKLLSNGNVTLVSSASKSAAIAEMGEEASIDGSVTIQQSIAPVAGTYHELSSQVAGATVSNWQQFFPITGPFAGSSGGVTPSMFISNGSSMVGYPAAGQTNQAVLEGGQGYQALMSSSEPFILQTSGSVYQQRFSFPMIGGTSTGQGVNLLGNPFASLLYWRVDDQSWRASGVGAVIAVKENVVVNGMPIGRYRYFSNLLGESKIGQGQAFWVQATNASPSLMVTERAKAESHADTVRNVYARLVLTQGGLRDEALIVFHESATENFDAAFDFLKRPNDGLFNLSTLSGQDKLAVNTLSNAFCSQSIRLGIEGAGPGDYQLSLESLTELADVGTITLHDQLTNQTVSLNSPYSFRITGDEGLSLDNRFVLQFSRKPLDTTGPQVQAKEVCSGDYASIVVRNAQLGVIYEVVNANDKVIASSSEATLAEVAIAVPVAQLDSGKNHVRIRALFPGCSAAMLMNEADLLYVRNFQVHVPDDFSVCLGDRATITASGVPVGGRYEWYDGAGTIVAGQTKENLLTVPITNETVYQVAGVLAGGCKSELKTIHVYADSLTVPQIIMHNDTLVAQVEASYQWYLNGQAIVGAVEAYYVPTVSGSYTVVASSSNCAKTSPVFQFTVDPGCTLDVTTPGVTATSTCGDNDASITLERPQNGVTYFVVNSEGETVSSVELSDGEQIMFTIGPDALDPGRNEFLIRAELPGCVNRVLEQKAVIDYKPKFMLSAEDTVSVCKGAAAVLSATGAPAEAMYRWQNQNGEVIANATNSTLTVNNVQEIETYYVTAMLSSGCESETLKIVVTPAGISTPVISVNGASLYTSALGSYQWLLNGEAIPMAVNQSFTPVESGAYSVVVSFNGCNAQSLPLEFFVTGVEGAPATEFVMSIYPVPASSQSMTVRIQSPRSSDVMIRVIDASGRTMMSQSFPMSELSDGLVLSAQALTLKDGIYYVIATQGKEEVRKKIIIKD